MTELQLSEANRIKENMRKCSTRIDNLKKFLSPKHAVEVKIKTPQDSCLEYVLDGTNLSYTINYLIAQEELIYATLEKKFEAL